MIACTRDKMISKLKASLSLQDINSVVLQTSKCFFTILNPTKEDQQPLVVTENDSIDFRRHLEILGSLDVKKPEVRFGSSPKETCQECDKVLF